MTDRELLELAADALEMAAPVVQGGAEAWSGWGCQYPGKMPRLYGERRIAELNCDWENGDQVLYFTAAPQPLFQLPEFATDPDDSDEVASLWDHGFKRGWNSCLEAATKTMQPAEQQPSTHWSHDNPGLADQYRAEALAARRSVGFEQDAYDVAPADIAAAIEALQTENAQLLAATRRAIVRAAAKIGEGMK